MAGGTSQKARRARRRRAALAAASNESKAPRAAQADAPAKPSALARLGRRRHRDEAQHPSPTSTPTTSGRVTARQSGRYTAPIPRSVRHSPPWYPFLIIGLLMIGVVMTVLNYLNALPDSPTDWYTVGGIICILAGVFCATFYR